MALRNLTLSRLPLRTTARRSLPGGYGRLRLQAGARSYASGNPTAPSDAVVASEEAERAKKAPEMLQKGAKRDPELYILLVVMSGAFGLAGWYFGRKPTSASSESKVPIAHGSMPWQAEGNSKDFKYQYHPGGDQSKALKDAPSALNTVIVPNVNLPKSMHERWNKWGKDGY